MGYGRPDRRLLGLEPRHETQVPTHTAHALLARGHERRSRAAHARGLLWARCGGHLEDAEIPELSGPFTSDARGALERFVRQVDTTLHEGIVMRVADEFAYVNFGSSVAKWVRKEHVGTSRHWMHAQIVPNGLAQTPSCAGASHPSG